MKIVLNLIPPTINKYIGRSNIWEYQKDKKELSKSVQMLTVDNNPEYDYCNITVTYFFKDKRRHDPSNYDKMLLDALIDANIITDDSYDVINEFKTLGRVDSVNPRTEILIEPLLNKTDFCMRRNCHGCKYEEKCNK